ncbi:hypothetical protein Tsubulata_034642, partial [Turnera subulata]
MASPPIYDSSGISRERSALVMDLGRIVLPKPNSAGAKGLKSKSAVVVQVPVDLVSSVTDTTVASTSTELNLPLDRSSPPLTMDVPEIKAPLQGTPLTTVGSSSIAPNVAVDSVPLTATVNRDSWARIVSNDSNVTPQPLEFVKPMLAADNSTICIPSELLDIGRKKYSLCLVGQFMGVMPKMGFIHAIFNKLWGRQGPISVSPYKEDLILVQFPIESALLRALSGGPWHVGGIPLVLRRWSSSLEKLDFSTAVLPTWVQLQNVPFELLTREGLSYLASAIGVPLHADQDCSKIFNGNSVNLCIEVDYSMP